VNRNWDFLDNTMAKALARAFRWGRCWTRLCTRPSTILRELEGARNVRRILRLTLLAPEIVEAILGCIGLPHLRAMLK
jgi:hypothetical protein